MNYRQLDPPAKAALGLGGVALLVWLVVRAGLPVDPVTSLIPVMVAAGLGWMLGRYAQRDWPWPLGAWGWTVGPALVAGLVALLWQQVRPLNLNSLNLLALLDGLFQLPALLAAAFVPLPGAAFVGLLVGQAVREAPSGLGATLATLLQVPMLVVLAELWLAYRRQDRSVATLAVAGALLGLGSFLTARFLSPGAFAPGDWPGVLVGGALAGGLAGVLAVRLRRELERRGFDRGAGR